MAFIFRLLCGPDRQPQPQRPIVALLPCVFFIFYGAGFLRKVDLWSPDPAWSGGEEQVLFKLQ